MHHARSLESSSFMIASLAPRLVLLLSVTVIIEGLICSTDEHSER